VPMGWEFNSAAKDLAPQIVRYFNSTLTDNDCFIGPVSGIGYIYPRLYPDLDAFLEITAEYWQWHGFKNIWLINDDLTMADDILTAYSGALPIGEQGIFVDYWPNADKGWYWASDGTPVVRSHYVYLVGTDQIQGLLDEAAITKQYLYPDVPMFFFVGVNGWGVNPTMLKGITESLDERYIVVRPDVMLALMREVGP